MKSIAAIIVLILTASAALAQNDSPCNQGRDPLKEPRNRNAICLPQIGRMDDFQGHCSIFAGGGQFGNQLAAVGDVDNSGTIDFVVGHRLCDSSVSVRAEELLLYKGVQSGIPSSFDGARIGPRELNSITKFIASGDWDDDGNRDIAVRIQILGDTTENNHSGYETSRLVIFWGNASATYSLNDTSRLSAESAMWLGVNAGTGVDIDRDGIDDLVVTNSDGFSNGQVMKIPWLHFYRGHQGKRWGRNAVATTADAQWWNAPYTGLSTTDQDGDGAVDIVFNNSDGDFTRFSVLYGKREGGIPDTSAAETIDLRRGAGRYGLLRDVTGDQIPELVIGSGRDDFIKVYVGLKGQRLLEQYGSGNDSAQAGTERWWGKPWATIWLPRKINPNWFGDNDNLYDLGDANLDGVGDLFGFSWPYVLVYTGGGRLDSLVDALVDITPGTGIGILKRLGNIDGSGRDIIAMTTGNEIRFYAPTRDVPSSGSTRRLPEGTGKAAVDIVPSEPTSTLSMEAIPNPSHDRVSLIWHGPSLQGAVTVSLYNVIGQEVLQCHGAGEAGAVECDVQRLAPGAYMAQIHYGDRTASTTILIR